jgi:hypothetical protein
LYGHLVHFVYIWYIFSSFGIMYQEKSGNPGRPICSAEQTPLTHIETIRISKESAVGKGIEILK